MEFVIGLLGAGIGAGIMTIIQMFIKRKWERDDRHDTNNDKIDKMYTKVANVDKKIDDLSGEVKHVKTANKAILADRIKWLGTQYLKESEIEFDDRRNLHELHDAYHNDCGGNGDYDILMRVIDELPLKRN